MLSHKEAAIIIMLIAAVVLIQVIAGELILRPITIGILGLFLLGVIEWLRKRRNG